MPKNEKKVGRADHNPEGAREAARGVEGADLPPASDSADARGHGAHGKGRDNELVDNDPAIEPDGAKGLDRGSAGWGSAASGGSTVDERSKKK